MRYYWKAYYFFMDTFFPKKINYGVGKTSTLIRWARTSGTNYKNIPIVPKKKPTKEELEVMQEFEKFILGEQNE